MSIANYTELQSAVAAWMHRADLTARIPDFIKMGEATLNRKLRTLDMEEIATLSATARSIALPAGFIEMQSLSITSPFVELGYVEPHTFRDYISDDSGVPSLYTLGAEIEFNITPDQSYPLECRYLKKYDIAADDTNWLLSNYPELYLHSSLAAAAMFIKDDARLSTIKSLLSEGIEECNLAEYRKRGISMAYMRMDEGLNNSQSFSMTTGI